MLQCCKTCGLLSFSDDESVGMRVPTCPHLDFVEHLSLGTGPGDSDAQVELMSKMNNNQVVVQIRRRFFAIEPSTDPFELDKPTYRQDTSPDDVTEQWLKDHGVDETYIEPVIELDLLSSHVTSLEKITEREQYLLMQEATMLAETGEPDDQIDKDPESLFVSAGRGNRFGFRYRFLGNSVYRALIDPFLWQHACANGFHRYNKSTFTDEMNNSESEISPYLLRRLAKVLCSESLLRNDVPTCCCEACGYPTTQDEALCPFCSENDEATLVYYDAARKVVSAVGRTVAVELSRQETSAIADMVNASKVIQFLRSNGRKISAYCAQSSN
jgi:hypothetical protein